MPKRQRRSRGRDGGRTPKRPRRHLYLVLDDWLWGYSIRKVDLSSDEPPPPPHNGISVEGTGRRLPPPVFRLESKPGFTEYFAAAFGTKIIAMNPHVDERGAHPVVPSCVAPCFDVRTRMFAFVPRPKVNMWGAIFFSVDERLFALCSGSFQMLHPPVPPAQQEPAGDNLCWDDERASWRELPKHPFEQRDVTSYAVHPDGRTVFVSTVSTNRNYITRRRSASAATFTFDTAEAHLNWKQHGKWALPFTGRAYFDSDLDAWVGLSADPGATGHICACDIVASVSCNSSGGRCMSWKLSKEKVFSEDPVESHVGATLVYMGGRSKFCLVQCVSIDVDVDDDCTGERNFYKVQKQQEDEDEEFHELHLFRLTTFSLKFDKDGHLTTGNSQRVRYYRAPEAGTDSSLEDPVAFWM